MVVWKPSISGCSLGDIDSANSRLADIVPNAHRRVSSFRDEVALLAAMQQPWSNGPLEGNVHRLKLIKRSMYGRANFDLLRLRVVHAA